MNTASQPTRHSVRVSPIEDPAKPSDTQLNRCPLIFVFPNLMDPWLAFRRRNNAEICTEVLLSYLCSKFIEHVWVKFIPYKPFDQRTLRPARVLFPAPVRPTTPIFSPGAILKLRS